MPRRMRLVVSTTRAKLVKLQKDLIGLAGPQPRLRFLPQVQDYLSYLSGDVSTIQLQQMSVMISAIRAWMPSGA